MDYNPVYFEADPKVKLGHQRQRVITSPIFSASFCSKSPLKNLKSPGTHTTAQKLGKRYEAKVLAKSNALAKWTALKSPWLQYIDSEGTHFCQPDLLLTNKNLILLCEIKLTHTSAAFFQMEKLYRPVLRRIFPEHKILSVEITRSFDPSIRFPQEMLLYFSIEDLLLNSTPSSNVNTISVLQWKL